jgi:hypothetical protein
MVINDQLQRTDRHRQHAAGIDTRSCPVSLNEHKVNKKKKIEGLC